MKKALWILLPCLGVGVAALVALQSCQRRFWEGALRGPFIGASYSGGITAAPVSVLAIPSCGQLEVHELQSYTNPVVLLRSARGEIQWSRLLVPERKLSDGTIERAGLRDLRLKRWEQRSTGSVVFVSCDWDWGGKEGGLILLDSNCGFKSFSLSW